MDDSIIEQNVDISQILRTQEDPLAKLFDLLDDHFVSNKGNIQQAILCLLEGKHQWNDVKKYALQWRKVKWSADFISRMRKRVDQIPEHKIPVQKFEQEFVRLIDKFNKLNQTKQKQQKDQFKNVPAKHQKLNLTPVPLRYANQRVPMRKLDSKNKVISQHQAITTKMMQLQRNISQSPNNKKQINRFQQIHKKQTLKKKQQKQDQQVSNLFGFLDFKDFDDDLPIKTNNTILSFSDNNTPLQQRKSKRISFNSSSKKNQHSISVHNLMKSPPKQNPQNQFISNAEQIKSSRIRTNPFYKGEAQWEEQDQESNVVVRTFNKDGKLTIETIRDLSKADPLYDQYFWEQSKRQYLGKSLYSQISKKIFPKKKMTQDDFFHDLQKTYCGKLSRADKIVNKKTFLSDSQQEYDSEFINSYEPHSQKDDQELEDDEQGINEQDVNFDDIIL